jgi:uncharacterized protein (DUF1330 family)
MSVYFVVQELVTDQEGVDAYLAAAGPTMADQRGRAIVFDPAVTPPEGEWHGERLPVADRCAPSPPASRTAAGE